MRYVRRKNFQEGEVLLFRPEVHWVFALKPLLRIFLVFLLFPAVYYLLYAIALFNQGFSVPRLSLRLPFFTAVVMLGICCIWNMIAFWNVEYGVTNKRLMIKRGVLSVRTGELPFDRIESIECYQSFCGRLLDYGTVSVSGIGGISLAFFMVHRPFAVRRKLTKILEKNKAVTILHDNPPPSPEEGVDAFRYGTFIRLRGSAEGV
jgi:uncharacterized membrane protein YdbT with pleckstrin-like domain